MPFKMHKIIFMCILKLEIPFKMHKIIFFPKKKIYVPTLPKFQTHYLKHIFFHLAVPGKRVLLKINFDRTPTKHMSWVPKQGLPFVFKLKIDCDILRPKHMLWP